jgi:hypothetical protein
MGLFSDLFSKYPELEKAKEELASIERQYDALEAENRQMRKDLAGLTTAREPLPFLEAAGVLWKTKTSGNGHESTPYCPTCRTMLADYSGSLLCMKCNWQAPIKSFEVPKVYHDLFGDKQ